MAGLQYIGFLLTVHIRSLSLLQIDALGVSNINYPIIPAPDKAIAFSIFLITGCVWTRTLQSCILTFEAAAEVFKFSPERPKCNIQPISE